MAAHRTVSLVAALLLTILVAGCSGSPQGTTPSQDAAGRYVIHMLDNFTFDPATAKVPVGATVVWLNGGTIPHDVFGYPGAPTTEDFPTFHSGHGEDVSPGEQFTHVFSDEGSWTIWCHRHHEEGMQAIVHVS